MSALLPASTACPPGSTESDGLVLSVEGLDVHYGGIHAVKHVGLRAKAGELTALVGTNGAGKSTTLKAICGLLQPTAGAIRFCGESVVGLPAHEIARKGLVLCPEGRRIFPDMSVDENLLLGAYTRRDSTAVRDDAERMRALFPVLKERARQMAGTLSGGEQQMLAIARALMARPRLLMLDEPSLGLAPLLVRRIFSVLKDLKAQRVTILLVEQNARQALQIADYAYVLETGRVVKEGPAAELARDPHMVNAYFGGEAHFG